MNIKTCINYLLTVSQHEVFQTLSDRLVPFGITPGQYGVLNCLWEKKEVTPKEIAQELALENSTVSGVLDRMQKKELISRTLDPNNRRSIKVILTPKGAALETDVLRVIDEVNHQVLDQFDTQTKENLISCLKRIGNVQ